ncbi:MAG: hypothetical protein JXA33_29590, partial [Anaerolineae bacterium]|nr:hypothetical protein [Anaerolineae bacterium]
MRRIAVLWSEFPPYVAACVRALAMREGVEVLVVRYTQPVDKPFDAQARNLSPTVHTISTRDPLKQQWSALHTLLRDFKPDVAVVSGWAVPAFNRAVRYVRNQGGIVICTSDNPWRGDVKHILGSILARPLLRHRYAAMFVPGARARPLANALGFTGRRLITGSYSCDWPLYAGAYARRREHSHNGWPHAFLFVGSLIERKGLQDIIKAYRAYGLEVDNPWELWVVGDGPLRPLLEATEGIVSLGFKQPIECAEVMASAGAFIL